MKHAEALRLLLEADVEPDRRVEGGELIAEDRLQLVLERPRLLLAREVAARRPQPAIVSTTRPIICFTLRSRSGEVMRPRKYFCATMFVAVCDQNFGNRRPSARTPAILAGDVRVAGLPLDLAERVAPLDREEATDAQRPPVDDGVLELLGRGPGPASAARRRPSCPPRVSAGIRRTGQIRGPSDGFGKRGEWPSRGRSPAPAGLPARERGARPDGGRDPAVHGLHRPARPAPVPELRDPGRRRPPAPRRWNGFGPCSARTSGCRGSSGSRRRRRTSRTRSPRPGCAWSSRAADDLRAGGARRGRGDRRRRRGLGSRPRRRARGRELQRVAFGQSPPGAARRAARRRRERRRRIDGRAVAAAGWTPVVHGVSRSWASRPPRPGAAAGSRASSRRPPRARRSPPLRLCVLSPGDDAAQRVYARAGFAPAATILHWSDPHE